MLSSFSQCKNNFQEQKRQNKSMYEAQTHKRNPRLKSRVKLLSQTQSINDKKCLEPSSQPFDKIIESTLKSLSQSKTLESTPNQSTWLDSQVPQNNISSKTKRNVNFPQNLFWDALLKRHSRVFCIGQNTQIINQTVVGGTHKS